jgi:hypothetical protein
MKSRPPARIKAKLSEVSRRKCDSSRETTEILRDRAFVAEIREGLKRLAGTRTRQTIERLFENRRGATDRRIPPR